MKILITGAYGFVGTHFRNRFDELGILFVAPFNRRNNSTLLDLSHVEEVFSNSSLKGVTHILHLAVDTKAGGYCKTHPADQFYNNQLINTHVLHAWHKYMPDAKMITFGTSAAYDSTLPMTEDNYMKGVPEAGYETYAMTKRMLLNGLESYNKQYGLNYVYYIPSTIYGPDYDLNDKHLVSDLVRKICNAKFLGITVPTLFGDGSTVRNIVYVQDVVNMVIQTMDSNNKLLNLCDSSSVSVENLAKYICHLLDYDYNKVVWDKGSGFGAVKKEMVLNNIFKDFKYTTTPSGLGEVIKYYAKKAFLK